MGFGARSRYFRENTVSDAQPWSVAELEREVQWFIDWIDVRLAVPQQPVQNDLRRSWWGSYGYRAQHAESD